LPKNLDSELVDQSVLVLGDPFQNAFFDLSPSIAKRFNSFRFCAFDGGGIIQ
jgi:hypothetical protein